MQLFAQFKASPILENPNSFLELLPVDFVRQKNVSLYQSLVTLLKENPIDNKKIHESWMHIKWYNRIIQYILISPVVSRNLKSEWAVECPNAGFQAVISDYKSDTSQLLELSLMANPEYICKLLLWSYEQKVELRYPLQIYLSVLFTDFYWTYYYHLRHKDSLFFEKFIKFHLENQAISANSLLTLLCLGHLQPHPSILDNIAAEPAVAFQTALLFPDIFDNAKLLFEASLQPKWAYHILTQIKNIPEDTKTCCLEAIKLSPPWYLEYLVKSGMWGKPGSLTLLEESINSTKHPLNSDLLQLVHP